MCYKITDSQAHMANVLDMKYVLQVNMVSSSRELRAPDDSLISDHWSKENLTKAFLHMPY